VLAAGERLALGTTNVGHWLLARLGGWYARGFGAHRTAAAASSPCAHLTPGGLLAAPGLWLGLVVAPLLLLAAARVRRRRGPLCSSPPHHRLSHAASSRRSFATRLCPPRRGAVSRQHRLRDRRRDD